jgi:hypothetical protein
MGRGDQLKRLVISAITVLAVALGATPVAAVDGGATIETSSVSFTITSAKCSNLPAGTTITGSGTQKSITTMRTDASGITTIGNSTHAHGTATDNRGNTYVFNYSNSFRVSNTTAHPGTFSGMMTDVFSLAGNGPAQLHNGFVAGITSSDGFNSASWDVKSSRGDPISFATGPIEAAHHCDPI